MFREVRIDVTSNESIVGNGRVLKFYLFIAWLYLYKRILKTKSMKGNVSLEATDNM